jgi:hypothetical protein
VWSVSEERMFTPDTTLTLMRSRLVLGAIQHHTFLNADVFEWCFMSSKGGTFHRSIDAVYDLLLAHGNKKFGGLV